MAILGFLFFASVFVASLWAIIATIAPRFEYIVALLADSNAAPVLVPVAQRRRVRRLSPQALRPEVRMARAAA